METEKTIASGSGTQINSQKYVLKGIALLTIQSVITSENCYRGTARDRQAARERSLS